MNSSFKGLGNAGIITVILTDPLSLLIGKITNNLHNFNAVGVYYFNSNNSTCMLFNSYDNNPVSWLRLGCSLEKLLTYSFVSKVKIYPLLNRSLEDSTSKEKFQIAVLDMITQNIQNSQSYTDLLLSKSDLVTGYTLVNNLLLKLREEDISININDQLIISPLLGAPTVLESDKSNNIDNSLILEEIKKELVKLAAAFLDLYMENNYYQEKVLETKLNAISELKILVEHLTGGLSNGILSSRIINEAILALNSSNELELIPCWQPVTNITVTTDEIYCSFNPNKDNLLNITELENLGAYLQSLAENNSASLTINLGTIINSYNRIVDKMPTIRKIPSIKSNKSYQALVIFSEAEEIKIPLKDKDTEILLPLANANLSSLDEFQLLQALIYIESLRDQNGNNDKRFSSLQNEITHELALRRNIF